MQLEELARTLGDYLATRNPSYRPRRLELARSAAAMFGGVNFNAWSYLYDAAFALMWQQMDGHKETQPEIYRELIEPSLRLFEPHPLEGGKRLAWVIHSASVGMYAPYKHVVAYLEGMSPCDVYVCNVADRNEIARLEDYGHAVFPLQGDSLSKVAQIREWCDEREIGALIADIYQSIPLALFAMRSAPRQAYLSPGFQLFPADVVYAPETQALLSPVAQRIPSPMLAEHLFADAEPLSRVGKRVYGVLGRYEKISADYLAAVSRILDADEEAVFVAYGRGTFNPPHERMIAGGVANPQRALKSIDVYLDTFPHSGGVSVWEAMANKVPVITLQDESVKEWNAFKPYVVSDVEAFVDGAVQLVNTDLRQVVIDAGMACANKFIRPDAGKILEEHLWQLPPIAN
jgi:hypothetical protein